MSSDVMQGQYEGYLSREVAQQRVHTVLHTSSRPHCHQEAISQSRDVGMSFMCHGHGSLLPSSRVNVQGDGHVPDGWEQEHHSSSQFPVSPIIIVHVVVAIIAVFLSTFEPDPRCQLQPIPADKDVPLGWEVVEPHAQPIPSLLVIAVTCRCVVVVVDMAFTWLSPCLNLIWLGTNTWKQASSGLTS
jgi:hypothetical protein